MSTTENKFFVILFFFTIVVCAPILFSPHVCYVWSRINSEAAFFTHIFDNYVIEGEREDCTSLYT